MPKIETSPKVLFSLGLAVTGLLMVGFLLVWPVSKDLAALNEEALGLSLKLEEHQALLPLYAQVRKDIADFGAPAGVAAQRLSQDRIGEIPSLLGDVAMNAGIRNALFTPDPSSAAKESGRILVTGSFPCDFAAAQALLARLAETGWVESLERVELKSGAGGLEARLRLWIALR